MIVIDPILVFLDWEIAPEDLPAEGLPLCIRIYDVTGITFDGINAHGFIDIDLEGLAGSGYCETGMQGREIVAEIGFIDAHGVFIALMRSAKAFVPPCCSTMSSALFRRCRRQASLSDISRLESFSARSRHDHRGIFRPIRDT